ncbi:hypothetical protein [Aquimarina sp. 2-A2]|uniref:hypothetical protein n=1 Tax=Aquimarina sp. 2-A2 TaxID=3382644 RepID=UPI00388E007B
MSLVDDDNSIGRPMLVNNTELTLNGRYIRYALMYKAINILAITTKDREQQPI